MHQTGNVPEALPVLRFEGMAESDPITAAITALVSALRQELRAQSPPPPPEPRRPEEATTDTASSAPRNLTPDSLLTVPEAMAELRIGRTHLYQLMGQGRLRPIKLGSRTLIQYREILRFIDELLID